MRTYDYRTLSEQELRELIKRPVAQDNAAIDATVKMILGEIAAEGDTALLRYTKRFDKNERLVVTREEWEPRIGELSDSQRNAIHFAFENIQRFHRYPQQAEPLEVRPGVTCWREWRPIERIGLYVPGGSAPLPSTLMMLGIPARQAGCRDLVVCTPPDAEGKLNPAIAYVADKLGIERVFLIGGAQAIAAMAYGTETVPKVDKIFGPGNRYVTLAKARVQSVVAIDAIAGPSEILIIADETARPEFIAADLLAQAEHGPDSRVVLLTTDPNITCAVCAAIESQLADLPRRDVCRASLTNAVSILVPDLRDAFDFSNRYAPEHLSLMIENADRCTSLVQHAGSVFCGPYSPVAAGDYASGTNHTLPTNGFARSTSGVSVESFMKSLSFQTVSGNGLELLRQSVETLAELETMVAHKQSVAIRR